MNEKYSFYVQGMHCTACVVLTETELAEHPDVASVKSSLATCSVEVCGNFGNKSVVSIMEELSGLLSQHSLSVSPIKKVVQWKEFLIAGPVALGCITLFILLQKIGIVNVVTAGTVTYGTAFVIGIIASLSTCMAVVGGLVLSLSANMAKEGYTKRPHIMFHLARLIAFFVLGGVIGVVGSVFQLSSGGIALLSFVIALVLLVLGINLLDILPSFKKFQITMPRVLGIHVQRITTMNRTVTPIILGVATFFLPCGFTQSMQIYTLTTGNFVTGALLMFSFALGTLPVLALISFSSAGLRSKTQSGVFFKTAGLVVLFFGLFNFINALVIAGIIQPLFTL